MSSEKKTLVLLIGTNPLPNYVVAKYYIEQQQYNHLVLIYTKEDINLGQAATKEFYEKIRDKLKLTSDNHTPIELNNASEGSIIFATLNVLNNSNYKEFIEDAAIINVNYTGGTKAMSVHVFNFFNSKTSLKNKTIFSYLDARKDRIIEEKIENNVPENCNKFIDICNYVKVDIDTMLMLHGYQKKSENDYINYPMIKKIDAYFRDNNGLFKFKEAQDFQEVIRGNFIFKNKLIDYYFLDLNKIKSNILDNINIKNLFPNSSELFNNEKNYKKNRIWIEYIINNHDYEHYIYEILNELKKNNLINFDFIGLNLKPEKNNVDSDLDVYVIKGYKLFVISVTRQSDKMSVKHKGFEVLLRARQVGGEEAKAILFCPNQSEKDIHDELTVLTGSISNNIQLVSDVKNNIRFIQKKLIEYIK